MLVVVNADDAITQKSLRNIPRVKVLTSGQLNTYDVLACDHVVFTQGALAEFVARTGGELVTVDKPAASRPGLPSRRLPPRTPRSPRPSRQGHQGQGCRRGRRGARGQARQGH